MLVFKILWLIVAIGYCITLIFDIKDYNELKRYVWNIKTKDLMDSIKELIFCKVVIILFIIQQFFIK